MTQLGKKHLTQHLACGKYSINVSSLSIGLDENDEEDDGHGSGSGMQYGTVPTPFCMTSFMPSSFGALEMASKVPQRNLDEPSLSMYNSLSPVSPC